MTYKCIIIGLGQIGMGYDLEHEKDKVYTHAKAFSESPDFDLIGGVDLSKTKRDLFSQKYKVNTYLDIESAIKVKRADLIIIASPTEKHYSILKQILNCSLPKAVLCEKPLAFDIHDAEEMVNLCKKYGVKLFVNYMRRSDPGVIEIKKRIKSRKILTPIKGVVWYSKGFIHNGSHFFNLLDKQESNKLFNFLNIGHLNANKNQIYLVKSFLDNFKGDLNRKLTVAGYGPQKGKIQDYIKKNDPHNQVNLLKAPSRKKVRQLIHQSNCLVVSSFIETFSVVIIESLSCGVPVVSVKSSGPSSIITNDDYGILCDIDQLGDSLKEVVVRKDSFQKEKLRNYVMNTYSEKVISQSLQSIYTSVCN